MSTYYSYYIGYKDKNGKIYPFGPYTSEGKLRAVICDSRSFASDLKDEFYPVTKDMVTDEFRNEFGWKNEKGEVELELGYLRYLPVSELPDGDGIKRGYFLLSDIESYLKDGDTWDIFTDSLSPEVYAIKAMNELKFGPPKPKKDEDGFEYTEHPASDYGYFAYMDWHSKESDASRLRMASAALRDEYEWKDGCVPVIILSID